MGRIWIIASKDSQAAKATANQLRAHFGDQTVEFNSLDKDSQTDKLNEGDVAVLFIEKPPNEQPLASSGSPAKDLWTELQHPLVLEALKSGLPLLPVLVDGLTMPNAEELPPAIRELAFKHATPVRNGSRLARDVGRLVNDLESQLQEVVGRSFGYEFLIAPSGFALLAWGIFFSAIRFREASDWSYAYEGVEQFDSAQQTLLRAGPIPLGAGMLLLSLSWCLRQRRNYLAARAAHYRSGQGEVPNPPNKLAAGCFCLGMAALGWGFLPGVLAWGLGLLALGRSRQLPVSRDEKRQILLALSLGLIGIYGSLFGLPPTESLRAAIKAYESGRQIFPIGEQEFATEEPPEQAVLDQAEAEYKKAIRIYPSYPNAYFRLAEVYAAKGQNEEALKKLSHALISYPTNTNGIFRPSLIVAAEAYQLNAEINQQLGNEQQALKDRDTADILTPFLDLSNLLRFW